MLIMIGPLRMTKPLSHSSCVDPQFNFWSLNPYELMVYYFGPLSWFIPRLIPPMTRLMWHTSLITHDLTCIPHHPHSLAQSFFDLENVAHSPGIPVAHVTIIMHPLQVMIAMTDTLTLVFSAWSRLKCFQKILHLWSLVTVSKFEKFSSVVLRKFASIN